MAVRASSARGNSTAEEGHPSDEKVWYSYSAEGRTPHAVPSPDHDGTHAIGPVAYVYGLPPTIRPWAIRRVQLASRARSLFRRCKERSILLLCRAQRRYSRLELPSSR